MDDTKRLRLTELLVRDKTVDEVNELCNLIVEERDEWYAQQQVKNTVDLASVSQQRELLIAYELENWEGSDIIQKVVEERVDHYLSNL